MGEDQDPSVHPGRGSRPRSRSRSSSPSTPSTLIRLPHSSTPDSTGRSSQTRESPGGCATGVEGSTHPLDGPTAAPSSGLSGRAPPPSMPEAGSTVVRLPISDILWYANSEACISKRSLQGSEPRRSVRSMKRLMPLLVSSSVTNPPLPPRLPTSPLTALATTDQADASENSGGLDEPSNSNKAEEDGMAIPRPAVGCNFPELLVRDLEESAAVFASRSMTAGRPSLGLETSDDEDDFDLTELDVRRCSTSAHVHRSPSRARSRSVVVSRDRHAPIPFELAGDDELQDAADNSDWASDLSLGMEPSSVRTREQSFTTEATSISGRCSSLVSQTHPVSPTSPSSAKGKQPRKGSWFDAEADADVDTDTDSRPEVLRQGRSTTPGPGRSTRAPRSRPSFDTTIFRTPDKMENSSSAELAGPSQRMPSESRPHTANGPAQIGRPRIVDISPPPTVPKRESSLKTPRRQLHLLVPSIAEVPKTPSMGLPRSHMDTDDADLGFGDGRSLRSQISSPLPVIATSCGRTVIDASKPPSFEITNHELSPQGSSTPLLPLRADSSRFPFPLETTRGKIRKPRFQEVMDRAMAPHPEEQYQAPKHQEARREEYGYLSPTPAAHARNPSFSTLASYAGSSPAAGALHLARTPTTTSSLSTPGIPLPPEVVETLRVSISCFPETMLLSSSLSVETIRAYSKKLRHRVPPSSPLRFSGDADNRSVFSFANTNSPKRPTFLRSPTSRWGFSINLRRNRADDDSFPADLGGGAEASLPSPSTASTVGNPAPVTSSWEPIRNIFPAASDFLCDALYAHIVAYNYVSILCPLPMGALAGDGGDEGEQQQQRIPKKAAHILGLQDAATPTTGGLRRMASRRAVGGGSPVGTGLDLREVQKGLRGCIGKLVAELKREGAGDGAEDGPLYSKTELMVDPLLMRSLCEVVRFAEEAL